MTRRSSNIPPYADTGFVDRLRSALPGLARAGLAAVVAILVGWIGYRLAFERTLGEIRASASHRLDMQAARIEREIAKFATFPLVMSYDSTIVDLTSAPEDAGRLAAANRYLERLNAAIGTLAVYVLDKDGRCIASSNWNQPDSFVGRDLSYRPYFRNVTADHIERFYGIGTTNSEPGYFLSMGIPNGSAIVATTVVKVGLEQLESSWSPAEAPAILVDEHDVVVLSSIPEWKYGTLRPLEPVERSVIAQTQQFNDRALMPIGMTVRRVLDAESSVVQLADSGASRNRRATGGLFLAESRPMPATPWRLMVFSDLQEAVGRAEIVGTFAAFTTLFLLGALSAFVQRHRHMRELTAARAALQLAHDNLERTVNERTSELLVANARLVEEVGERSRAERTLREAQEGLVQTGKLAVIGRLSAGIAHELNQPLAALATISGNTIKFLDRGDPTAARSNLERILALIARMGKLTGELKSFARKSSGELHVTAIRKVVDNALFLLEHRIERGAVTIVDEVDEDATAWCDPNRLEQVLINLIGNALDAMEGHADRRLHLKAVRSGEKVVVEIRDNGPGLPDELLAHLFEPFHTTKAPGMGLGLGLAISAGIVRDYGGDLTAENVVGGGASFVMRLPARMEAAE